MTDEHFHEIQLSGKQLVFLFMATAVVAIVIFLTGVMVGRGVRAERETSMAADLLAAPPEVPAATLIPGTTADGSKAAASAAAKQAPATQAADEFSYYAQLEGQAPKAPAAAKPAPVTPESEPVVSESVPPPIAVQPGVGGKVGAEGRDARAGVAGGAAVVQPGASARTGAQAPGAVPAAGTPSPSGAGAQAGEWAVQVAALIDSGAAEAEAKKLLAKGYPAYVVAPAAGARSPVFRVRVGHFTTKGDAEEMKRRLEKERYKPLITR